MLRFLSASLVLAFIPALACAQTLQEARIEAQPLVYMKEGSVDGCGVRLFAFDLEPTGSRGRGWDVSFNFWKSGIATAKGMAYNIDMAEIKAGKKPRSAPIDSFFIKPPNGSATQPLKNQVFAGEDAGSLYYATPLDTVIELFKATGARSQLTIGLRRKGEKTERLYFGVPQMSEPERSQFAKCIDEVSR